MLALGLLVYVSACSGAEERERSEGREVVEVFDAIMDAAPRDRGPRVERLRALSLVDASARLARQRCLLLFDSIARASTLQERLEPMAAELDGYADAGRPVPTERRAEVLRLYTEADAATRAASDALAPCTEAMNGLRAHRARRR